MIRLRMEPNSGTPLGLQIERQIRLAIAAGRLAPGGRLPSARDLATSLQVNFHTVRKAYNTLEEAGLLRSRRGLGTFVADEVRPLSAAELRRRVAHHVERLVEDLAGLDLAPRRLEGIVVSALRKVMGRKGRWMARS